jgi:hypothetical protein
MNHPFSLVYCMSSNAAFVNCVEIATDSKYDVAVAYKNKCTNLSMVFSACLSSFCPALQYSVVLSQTQLFKIAHD